MRIKTPVFILTHLVNNKSENIRFIFMSVLIGFLFYLPAVVIAKENARYVQIELPGKERVLSLAEVEVYSGNKNIAKHGRPTQSGVLSKGVASKAIDSITSGHFFDGSVTHTNSGNQSWWRLDLGAEHSIDKIVIYNRTDCCLERFNPAKISLLNNKQQIIWQSSINTDQEKYEFEISNVVNNSLPISRNLLRNASFHQQTNHSLPDYWDLHHAAARSIKRFYGNYGVDESVKSPIKDTKTLRVSNSNKDFHHLIVMPWRLFKSLPEGKYTFSVYIKASSDNQVLQVTSGWAIGKPIVRKLSTKWRRYQVTYDLKEGELAKLQPVLTFPDVGTYFIAAPQLELGSEASKFFPSYDDNNYQENNNLLVGIKKGIKGIFHKITGLIKNKKEPLLSAVFEYDYYTNQKNARIIFKKNDITGLNANVKCTHEVSNNSLVFNKSYNLIPDSIDIPIGESNGLYTCDINGYLNNKLLSSSKISFNKYKQNSIEIRINNDKRFILINNRPFYIIGMATSGGITLPDWYLNEIKEQGINTVFLKAKPQKSGQYDVASIKNFVSRAAKYKLKVIIGWPLMGKKATDWEWQLLNFEKLVVGLIKESNIIAWFPVDEPAAYSWDDKDLLRIYKRIKNIDPYRVVFINWAYDGIPQTIGDEPRGTLNATDIYSVDYYPFAGQRRSINGYTDTTLRVLETSKRKNKISHSWLQIYGGGDAWREPTGDELNYMAYLNYVYGSMISYWETKSNSKETWDRILEISKQGQALADQLFLHPDAKLVDLVSSNNFMFSLWARGNQYFLIVVNNSHELNKFIFHVPDRVQEISRPFVQTMFHKQDVPIIDNKLEDYFKSLESKVYVFSK